MKALFACRAIPRTLSLRVLPKLHNVVVRRAGTFLFSAALNEAVKSRNHGLTLRLTKDCLSKGVLPRCYNPSSLILVLCAQSEGMNVAVELVTWLQRAHPHSRWTAYAIHGLMKYYCQKGDVRECEWWMQQAKTTGHLNADLYNTMIEIYATKGRDLERCLAWLDEMADSNVVCTALTYTLFIRAFKEAGKLSECWRVFEHSAGSRDVTVYNAMVSALRDAGQPDGCANLFAQMKEEGIQPNEPTYGSILVGCASRKDWDQYKLWAERMKSDGLHLNAATYSHMLKLNKTEMGKCLHWFSEMMHDASALPDEPAFRLLVDALSQAGDIEQCYAVLDMAKVRGVLSYVSFFNVLMHASAVAGDIAQCLRVLELLREHNLTPNFSTLNVLIKAFSVVGDSEMADACAEELRRHNIQPSSSAHNSLIQLHTRLGQPEKADQWRAVTRSPAEQ